MTLENGIKIEFCEAKLEELEKVECVLKTAFNYAMKKDNFSFQNPNDFIDDLKHILELGGKVYVAKCQDEIIGTISYKLGEKSVWYLKGECIMLCHLGVLPDYQKYGIGKELINFMESNVKNFNLPICLSTPEKNTNAINFYINNGYKKIMIGFATDHYSMRFIKWQDEVPFDDKLMRRKYLRSAMLCRMKHYEICSDFNEARLNKFWNERFAEHYINQPKEVQEDMFNTYLKRNITPINYLRQKEANEQNERDMDN